MRFEDFIASRVEMTVTQFLNTYLSENDREGYGDTIKMHVYADGMPIQQLTHNRFFVVIERSEYTLDSLDKAEHLLWEQFAEEETQHYYN